MFICRVLELLINWLFVTTFLQIYARGVNITVIVEFLLLAISVSIWTIVPTPVAIAVKSSC